MTARSAASPAGVDGSPPMLELTGLCAAYGAIEVLHGVDLTVPKGGLFAVLGPNGAGKSTLLRVIAGLHAVGAGTVAIDGRAVSGSQPVMLARRGVCLLPEGRGVFPNLTIAENLRLVTHLGASLSDVEARVYETFPVLGSRRRQLAGTLSGGEQQMLALARAVATEPSFLLLDELSTGLAPRLVEMLYGHVVSLVSSGTTVLAVEQFARTVLEIAHAGAVMVTGRVAATGAPAELNDALAGLYLGAS
ncbi:MAG: ABC transporter ATP-binding protein [Streptosporangiaceae bacterium]